MISIKKFLTSDSREWIEAYERMANSLLQAIGLHAVEGERADYDAFRATIADLEASVAREPSPSGVLIATGAAVKALQDYNRRTSFFIRGKSAELQIIVEMLTDAIGQITTASQTSIARLQDLQKQIGQAVMLEDMRSMKLRLSECLDSMRVESGRQRSESVRVVAGLQQGLKNAREAHSEAAPTKPELAAGLPLRSEAEAAMQRACDQQSHTYAALFVLDRIQAINSRFGDAVGDQVLTIFRKHLARGLSAQDEIFLWGPESFLALLHRTESGEQVRRELGRFLAGRLDETFEIGNRSVTLPIASTWTVIPLFESSYNLILKKIEAFGVAGTARTP